MAWILIQGPKGLRRVPENTPFRLEAGEGVIGSERDETETQLHNELHAEGIGFGDFIEKAIKLIPEAIRPQHCSQCEKRKQVLNRVRELGVKETLKQLREIK